MRASASAMSEAVDLCITAFEAALVTPTSAALPRPDETAGDAALQRESTKDVGAPQMMALTALRHVRDVLGGQAHAFDASVLEPLRQSLQPQQSTSLEAGGRDPAAVEAKVALPKADEPKSVHSQGLAATPSSTNATEDASASPLPTPPAVSSPSLLLSGRTDKPLPALSRTPVIDSSSTESPAYPPRQAVFPTPSIASSPRAVGEASPRPRSPVPQTPSPPSPSTRRTGAVMSDPLGVL